MMDRMLVAARFYHDEGLCVIPIVSRGKRPAIPWDEYQQRRSTSEEIETWFGNSNGYNVGAVHGEVSNNYVLLDLDHDAGLFKLLKARFPQYTAGRVIRSGSGEGYHVPLLLEELPDFGWDAEQKRKRGNRTWKTQYGHLNIRCRWCQSVLPPSVHPSGNEYRFLQRRATTRIDDLSSLIVWLDGLAPPVQKEAPLPRRQQSATVPGQDLVADVKAAWGTALAVFEHLGITGDRQRENGETRITGHGGLLVKGDGETWYNFSDEIGGGVVEAWGWCRFGSAYDKRRHFRQCLLEMAQSAGIDAARYYRQGDEQVAVKAEGDRSRWSKQYSGAWERIRG